MSRLEEAFFWGVILFFFRTLFSITKLAVMGLWALSIIVYTFILEFIDENRK